MKPKGFQVAVKMKRPMAAELADLRKRFLVLTPESNPGEDISNVVQARSYDELRQWEPVVRQHAKASRLLFFKTYGPIMHDPDVIILRSFEGLILVIDWDQVKWTARDEDPDLGTTVASFDFFKMAIPVLFDAATTKGVVLFSDQMNAFRMALCRHYNIAGGPFASELAFNIHPMVEEAERLRICVDVPLTESTEITRSMVGF